MGKGEREERGRGEGRAVTTSSKLSVEQLITLIGFDNSFLIKRRKVLYAILAIRHSSVLSVTSFIKHAIVHYYNDVRRANPH